MGMTEKLSNVTLTEAQTSMIPRFCKL